MRRWIVLSVACAAAPLEAQAPRDIVARGLAAMGGEATARNLPALAVDYYSVNFGLGRSETPAWPWGGAVLPSFGSRMAADSP